MSRFDLQLWHRFLAIAQPYFFPVKPGNNRIFLGLLVLLMLFLFAAIFLAISLFSLISQWFFADFFHSIAPGLNDWIKVIFQSPWLPIIALMIFCPLIAFFHYRQKILPQWKAWGLLTVLLALTLSVSWLNVIISYVSNFFSTALAEKDQPTFWRFIFVYASVFVLGTPLVVLYRYTREKLGLCWREWMTNNFLDKYFANRAYYQLHSDYKIDNPDQRIAEDIKTFTGKSLSFLMDILGSVFDIVFFLGILWSISPQLSLILLAYAGIGTAITVIIGKNLVRINFQQLRQEANFRYSLIHVRDHAESIAFYQGEQQELFQIKKRFTDAIQNFNLLIGWQRNVDYFTTGYGYAVIILPSIFMAPLYFSGGIKYGTIIQAGYAFGQVLSAFSLVVDQIEGLTAFAAGINRLAEFSESLEAVTNATRDIKDNKYQTSGINTVINSHISLQNLTVNTPKYTQTLIKDLSTSVKPGQGLLIVGQSGTGKSSILRTISGLWNSGTGRLVRPNLAEMIFLPQRPYMVLGSLRAQLLYPCVNRVIDDAELRYILKLVNLANLPDRFGGFDTESDWSNVLSLGEQQRLAFARLLLSKPRYAILDEATSALDLRNEADLYKRLEESHITFISVGHRASLVQYHQQVLELLGDTRWRLISAEDYYCGNEIQAKPAQKNLPL